MALMDTMDTMMVKKAVEPFWAKKRDGVIRKIKICALICAKNKKQKSQGHRSRW